MTHPLRLYAFNCGWFQCKPSFFIESDTDPNYIRSPVPAYLIEHPKGRALFDTGLGVRYARTLENARPANKFGLQIFEGMDIAARLKAIGIDPASIDWIINSHFHADHCGGNVQIPNATIIVQSRELAAAQASEDRSLYDPAEFSPGHPFKAIDGELDLFADGTVMIVPTYGHTPGHQSARVKLASGEVLLAADCCYIQRNLDEMKLPGFTFDKQAGLATLERLRNLRNAGTRIYFGHDAEMWKSVAEGKPIS